MSKSIQNESLGFTFTVSNVPETVEEFDANAKHAGAALEEAINNVRFRGVNGDFRSQLAEKVESETGEARKVEPARAAKENEKQEDVPTRYSETESVYINRVIASELITKEAVQKLADGITIVFDASPRERSSAGPALAKQYIDAAKKAILEGKQDKLAAQIAAYIGTDVATDETSLAKGLAAYFKKQKEEAASQLAL